MSNPEGFREFKQLTAVRSIDAPQSRYALSVVLGWTVFAKRLLPTERKCSGSSGVGREVVSELIELSAVIADIYDAAIEPALWQQVLASILAGSRPRRSVALPRRIRTKPGMRCRDWSTGFTNAPLYLTCGRRFWRNWCSSMARCPAGYVSRTEMSLRWSASSEEARHDLRPLMESGWIPRSERFKLRAAACETDRLHT